MEGLKFKTRSSGAIGIVIVVCVVLLFIVAGTAAGMTLSAIRNGTRETPVSIFGGSNCIKGSAPETTMEYEAYRIPSNSHDGDKVGVGKISHEDHLATTPDGFSTEADVAKLKSDKYHNISEHLANTNFSKNCPSSASICGESSQYWVDGGRGSGTTPYGKIPAEAEAWYMNTRWNDDGSDKNYNEGHTVNPPPGTKVIIYSPKTNKAIVTVAGYEWGPNKIGTGGNLLGATAEVLGNLGIDHGADATFGFAKDQSLVPGTVYSPDCQGTVAGDGLVMLDPGHGEGGDDGCGRGYIGGAECENNFLVAQKVKTILEGKGAKVALTKQNVNDNPVLAARSSLANSLGAGTFVSIHSNSGGGSGPIGILSCNHPEVAENNEPDYLSDSQCPQLDLTNRSKTLSRDIVENIKSAYGSPSAVYWGSDLGVLKGLTMPAVLVEMFYHDNSSDLAKYNADKDKMAQAIANGILKFMGK